MEIPTACDLSLTSPVHTLYGSYSFCSWQPGPFRVRYRGKECEGEDVEAELVFSQALCERGFVPKWCEEEEMDREAGGGGEERRVALSGEGQRVKPVGSLGDGAPPKRW